ncbi:hypothetical protein O6H91_05G115200 [Diphasiastrum complanatum]|uniref:Uncharacterized protein n=1 Tax=Diphasiastrum complanatum TaxID=34168 RepID=A0ACC2DSU4_DIPCM|nr:hypothetical protein O6H91_05G115200 [Diphasiastrum complanatum]
MANSEVFDAYFRQADYDKDGRVSGAEAVAFFKGANLPQLILAKIWQYSDQRKTGFLSREEFYNALKLVTIAQAGRELTPEIVQAAFTGPATLQIPAPQISSGPSPVLATKNVVPLQASRINNTVQQPPPVEGFKSQYPPPTSSQIARPAFLQVRPNSASFVQSLSTTGLGVESWGSSKPPSPALQIEVNSMTASHVQPQVSPMLPGVPVGGPSFQAGSKNAFNGAPYEATSTGSAASSFFSTTGSTVKSGSVIKHSDVGLEMKESGDGSLISGSKEVATKVAPGISALSGNRSESSMQARHMPIIGANLTQIPPSTGPNTSIQATLVAPKLPSTMAVPTDLGSQGSGAPPSGLGTVGGPWPKMSQSDVERYSRVFIQVDTDKDGKISGIQARDLFLSWKLPRELLKQVWNLSDQDGDSMLSLREFCTALYLMERHREGRPLPTVLPAGFNFEDNGHWQSIDASRVAQSQTTMTQKSANIMFPSQQLSGFPQPAASRLQIPVSGPIPLQAQIPGSNETDSKQEGTYKSKAPTLEINLVNQLSKEEQANLKLKQKDAEEADKKVYELEKDIMDSQKKIESYRTKLQEIILLKSRCDNRLAEVTERSGADRREVEALARKYDAKFKQAGEVNSRLQAEEAMFRDIQERKMELYNSIAHIEKGDTSISPQARVDGLAADLHELKKTLTSRAKQIGLRLKPPPSSEATFGGQLEIQESFVEWDEDWDKFDDEGFASIQELMNDRVTGSTTAAVTAQSPVIDWDEGNLFEDKFDFSSESHIENKLEVHSDETSVPGPAPIIFDSPRAESEAGSQSSIESPQHDTLSPRAQPFRKGIIGGSLLSKAKSRYDSVGESQDFDTANESFWPPKRSMFNSDLDDADKLSSWESELGGTKYEVEADLGESWGLKSTTPSIQKTFDVGASNVSTFNRQTGARPSSDSYSFIDSLDFGSLRVSTSASRTGATEDASDFYGSIDAKGWGDHSETSVPGTPLFKVDSPRRSPSLLGDEFNDGPHSFSRFDSISSTRGGGRVRGLASFDDGDPFAGTGPFGLTAQASKSSEHWGAF